MSDRFIVTTAKSAQANGVAPIYVETEDGRKAAAIWGKGDERYARAYLFAAAPELLSALKDILAYGVDSWDATKHLDAVSRARDAIAAAEDTP